MSRPYRPSNGTEGGLFMARWCERCVKDSEEHPCGILGRSLGFQIGDPEYPSEWVVEDDGLTNPRCTAFEQREALRVNRIKLHRIRSARRRHP